MRFKTTLILAILSALGTPSTAYLYTHQKIPLVVINDGHTNHLTTCITIPPLWTVYIQEAPHNKLPPRNFPNLCHGDGYSPLAVVCQVKYPNQRPHQQAKPFKAVYCVPKHPDDEVISIDDHVALASQLRVPFGDDGSECIPEPKALIRWLKNDEEGEVYQGEDYEIKQQRKLDEFHKILGNVKIPIIAEDPDYEVEVEGRLSDDDRRPHWEEPETPQTPWEMRNFAGRKGMRKISGIDNNDDYYGSNTKSAGGRSVAASLLNVIEDVNEPSSRRTPPELQRSPDIEPRSDNVVIAKKGKNRWIACIGRVCGYFDPRKLRRGGDGMMKGRIVPSTSHDITPALDTAREHV